MKLSNKLLTGLAAALILIPLVGMIYVSQVKYKKGTYRDMQSVSKQQDQHLNTPSNGMTQKELSAFTSVNLEVAGNWHLNVIVVQDQQPGIKIQNDMDKLTTLKVDEKGCLHIGINGDEENRYRRLIIYSPSLQQLEVTKAKSVELSGAQDSLYLNLRNLDRFSLAEGTKINRLKLDADKVGAVSIDDVQLKSLLLNLGGASFYTAQSSFDELSILASGKAELQLGSDGGNTGLYTIKHLNIQTSDNVSVKIGDVKIERCSGSFSDQTTIVEMPAVNLNQMYKK
ncbi:hypothetical protein D9M68_546510 [compost metagenome]